MNDIHDIEMFEAEQLNFDRKPVHDCSAVDAVPIAVGKRATQEKGRKDDVHAASPAPATRQHGTVT
jgi:hypothetical protein